VQDRTVGAGQSNVGNANEAGTTMSSCQSSTWTRTVNEIWPTRYPCAYLIGIGIRIRLHNSYDYQK
jgi:hypothetical protein